MFILLALLMEFTVNNIISNQFALCRGALAQVAEGLECFK